MKKLLRALMPGTYRQVRARFGPYGRLLRIVKRRQGQRVTSGPFAGMRYLSEARGLCARKALPLRQAIALYDRDTDTTPPQQWACMTPTRGGA